MASHDFCQSDNPLVGILVGSKSDLDTISLTAELLDSMSIPYEIRVASAHRTPDLVTEYAGNAVRRGLRVLICGAGLAAHLAGVTAAHTPLPVIGVPMDASSLGGIDALLSTAQMPPGVPVAAMGTGSAGAKNSAFLAARILALQIPEIGDALDRKIKEMRRDIESVNATLGVNDETRGAASRS